MAGSSVLLECILFVIGDDEFFISILIPGFFEHIFFDIFSILQIYSVFVISGLRIVHWTISVKTSNLNQFAILQSVNLEMTFSG